MTWGSLQEEPEKRKEIDFLWFFRSETKRTHSRVQTLVKSAASQQKTCWNPRRRGIAWSWCAGNPMLKALPHLREWINYRHKHRSRCSAHPNCPSIQEEPEKRKEIDFLWFFASETKRTHSRVRTLVKSTALQQKTCWNPRRVRRGIAWSWCTGNPMLKALPHLNWRNKLQTETSLQKV